MTEPTCSLCGQTCADQVTICADCERAYGQNGARLLARAERDPGFAQTCLANLPAALRAHFASLLGQRCLVPGADSRLRPGLCPARPRVDPKWLRTAN